MRQSRVSAEFVMAKRTEWAINHARKIPMAEERLTAKMLAKADYDVLEVAHVLAEVKGGDGVHFASALQDAFPHAPLVELVMAYGLYGYSGEESTWMEEAVSTFSTLGYEASEIAVALAQTGMCSNGRIGRVLEDSFLFDAKTIAGAMDAVRLAGL